MTEILTESFCERCGTRYTFEAAIRKKRRIGKLKLLSKGLKNYVLSDDASLDEALAEARSEEQREVSGGQLDAFHQTFQFCMSCRQYTCANCWNETEGRCLSCAPLSIGAGELGSPLDNLLAGGGMSALVSPLADPDGSADHGTNGNGHTQLEEPRPQEVIGTAWPTIDLFRTVPAEPIVENTAEAVIDTGPPVVAQPEIRGEGRSSASTDEEAAPASAEGELSVDFWTRPFTGYAPTADSANDHHPEAQSESVGPTAEDVAATPNEAPVPPARYDWQSMSSAAPIVEPDEDRTERAISPADAPTPAVEITPDALADELAARTTRLLGRFRVKAPIGTAFATAQPAPVMETQVRSHVQATPEPVVAATDRVEVPAWPTLIGPAARDVTPAVPTPVIQSAPVQAPQWPAPLRPGVDLSTPPFWASGDSGRVAREADLWTASAQEVSGATGQPAVQVGVQACVDCGLSLSATARFCRRCGSRQG
jgi:hypothetical protein